MSKLKYVDTKVTFSEVPDEISLCISISNCPHRCKGCHSEYLQHDIGEELTFKALDTHIGYHDGITCVCFMGDAGEPLFVSDFAKYVKSKYGLKTALYTGLDYSLNNIYAIVDKPHTEWFDYIKTGHYDENRGPLTSRTTNQRMYKKVSEKPIEFEDITYMFWK